jgi:hypothetical protein
MSTISPPPEEPDTPPGRGSSVMGSGVRGENGVPIDPATRTSGRTANPGWYVLLLVPFVALLWLPFYARRTPELFGFPFFYWYQFLWVFLGAGITGLVYLLTTTSDTPPSEPAGHAHGSHRRGGRP